MPRSLCLLPLLLLLPHTALPCSCQSSYTVCNEAAASTLVFIGTVESIDNIFLNRWNAQSPASLRTLNSAYLEAQAHPSEAALAHLKDLFFQTFPDLPAADRLQLQSARTVVDVASLFYSSLTRGERVRFKSQTVFKREQDDDTPGDDEDDPYIEIATPFGDCGIPFQTGETYLVYANNDENSGILSVTTCTKTRRLTDAGEDLPYLYFLKNRPSESSRLTGFTTTDAQYQLRLDKMHDPVAIREPVPGTVLELRSPALTRYTQSDPAGKFIFDGLPEGDYTLSAFAPAYPAKTELLAGPRAFRIEEQSCARQILLLPKSGGQ